MTGIHPFRGMLVRPDAAHDVVSPAYDAMGADQRRTFRAQHPHSYLHVTRSADDEPDAATVDNATLVQRGRVALEQLIDASLFEPVGDPALFMYRLIDDGHVQCGLVCEMPSEYYHSVARPHEATQAARAALLAEHFETVRAASSPVACAVRDDGSLEQQLNEVAQSSEPVLDFATDDGLRQSVWRVNDAGLAQRIATQLEGQALFIIDGHHRSEANRQMLAAGQSVPVLAAVFPEQSLRLVGFHRLVKLQPAVEVDEIIRRIGRRFRVETVSDVASVLPGRVAFVANGEWHVVWFDEPPIGGGAAIRLGSLDPVVLEREILRAIIGDEAIVDVTYAPDTDSFGAIVDQAKLEGRVPFFVPPVANEDMMAVAEGGEIMPAKSTYFTPKVRSGIFLRLLEF